MEIMNQLHFKKPMKQQMVKRGKLLNHTVAIVIPKIELKLKKFEFNPKMFLSKSTLPLSPQMCWKEKNACASKEKGFHLLSYTKLMSKVCGIDW